MKADLVNASAHIALMTCMYPSVILIHCNTGGAASVTLYSDIKLLQRSVFNEICLVMMSPCGADAASTGISLHGSRDNVGSRHKLLCFSSSYHAPFSKT